MSRAGPSLICTAARRAAWTAVVTALLMLVGCTVRNDPSFNPYARGGGEGTLMDRAEQAMSAAEEALDSLDARLENSVW